jgi:proteasome lid subunit RPN8/RPN11
LEDHTGNQTHRAKIADTAPVARLIASVVTQLGLPITDPAGRPIAYRLSHNNRQLMDDETLATANVQPGDTLTIVPEMTAGGESSGIAPDGPPIPPVVTLSGVLRETHPQAGFPSFAAPAARARQVGVYLDEQPLRAMVTHSVSHPEREVGGILLGEVYEEDARFLVRVNDVCAASRVVSDCASLRFTGESWLDILKERRARPRVKTLGWYHSHPGLGVFMSGMDEFSHQSFFGDRPWYVALVIDPVAADLGAFTWEHGRLIRSPWYTL